MSCIATTLVATTLVAVVVGPLARGVAPTQREATPGYLDDYAFVCETVAREAASPASKKIDWARESAKLRPRFLACESDLEHVVNVMRLLALLQDSHTGVTRTAVKGARPAKFDGLFGAGAWLGWDAGRWTLRALMDGHPLESDWPPGSAIVEIDGWPTAWILERERRRIALHSGISSEHSLFASLANRGLPFGDRQRIALTWCTPEGDRVSKEVSRWGPGGKAFNPRSATLPSGLVAKAGAMSTWIDLPGAEKVGYLRISGSMNAATVAAFHAAFDRLEGLQALLLDCRAMGGGSDGSAWEMAGRLFPRGTDNGTGRRIEPSGSWQFDGPVVMLQDALEVSAAETFTWAVSEPGRVVSVGRSTGGWAIIPRNFDCPSGLCSFRLGVRDRGTPVRNLKTEGVGWPADIALPMAAGFAEPGRARRVGEWVLSSMLAGASAEEARATFACLFGGQPKRFHSAARRWKNWGFDADEVAGQVRESLRRLLVLERRLLRVEVPDAVGSAQRYPALVAKAKAHGLKAEAASWKKALALLSKEASAQSALFELLDENFLAEPKALEGWKRKHGKTAWGRRIATRQDEVLRH